MNQVAEYEVLHSKHSLFLHLKEEHGFVS
jgi:hypothetical protein